MVTGTKEGLQKIYDTIAHSDKPKVQKNYKWLLFIQGLCVKKIAKRILDENPGIENEEVRTIIIRDYYPEALLDDIVKDVAERYLEKEGAILPT